MLAEIPEHVPLLITSHQKSNAAAANVTSPLLHNNSDSVVLSTSSPAHVMRARLNQYRVTGYQNSMIVNIDNGITTTTSSTKASVGRNKKKKSADI